MRSVQTLINEAIRKCGSVSALAREIHVNHPEVHEMKAGRRPVSPMVIGLLCAVMGLPIEEAQELAINAIIDTAKKDKKGTLEKAFLGSFKSQPPTPSDDQQA